jgi:hypothetical protein
MSNLSLLLICDPTQPQLDQVKKVVCENYEVSLAHLETHPDFHVVNDLDEEQAYKAVQIAQVRTLTSSLSLSPYQGLGKNKQAVFVLLNIDQASIPAQNALLKSLEEPPQHVQLILATCQADKLLPTIRSRCQVVQLTVVPYQHSALPEEEKTLFATLPTLSISQALTLSEQYKDRTAAQQFLDHLFQWLYAQNQATPDAAHTSQLQHLVTAQELLSRNVNARLVIEDFLFSCRR